MLKDKIFDEIAAKVSEIVASSPVKDLEKNLRALLASAFTKLDLVTREEFDIQKELLMQSRTQLDELEARVVSLERPSSQTPSCNAQDSFGQSSQ